MNHRLLLLIAAPVLLGAAPAWQQRTLASAGPFIDRANDEWTRAIVTGDAAVMSAPYDQNGVFIGPDGSVTKGREAVRAMYASRPAAVKVLHASILSEGRVAPDRDDVYEWGTAHMTVQRGGKVKDVAGRYLTVWHREGRRWLIARNIAF